VSKYTKHWNEPAPFFKKLVASVIDPKFELDTIELALFNENGPF
jgi:hypothetical protein